MSIGHCHALNYTAACIPDLESFAEWASRKGWRWGSLATSALIQTIEKSQHFVLPDGGRLLDDELRGLRSEQVRLPFQAITVEYFTTQDDQHEGARATRRIGVASEMTHATLAALAASLNMAIPPHVGERIIAINAVSWMDDHSYWRPQALTAIVDSEWEAQDPNDNRLLRPLYHKYKDGKIPTSIPRIGFVPIPLLPEFIDAARKIKPDDRLLLEELAHDISDETTAVFELCEALTCSNVHVERLQAVPKSVNDKRVAAGKLRLPDAWCLTIDVPHEIHHRSPGDGTHRSPRTHLRRGHIRRLTSGKRVWVNSHVVGSGNTKIDKHYHLKPSEQGESAYRDHTLSKSVE